MATILINVTEGSEVTSVYSDDSDVTRAIIQEVDADPVVQDIACNPEMISELEAKISFTADDLPDEGEDDAATDEEE